MDEYEVCTRFVQWLDGRVTRAARGTDLGTLEVEPRGRIWLGRLAPEAAVVALGLGERGERLDPCATGIRLVPDQVPLEFRVRISARAWLRTAQKTWKKSEGISEVVPIQISAHGTEIFGGEQLANALAKVCGRPGLTCVVRTEFQLGLDGRPELTVLLVNTSPETLEGLADTNLYECKLEVTGLIAQPFLLEGLPDSFRYDRRVPAYGINCGVSFSKGIFKTTDTVVVDRGRPEYWSVDDPQPDLRFSNLAADPFPALESLASYLSKWGGSAWGSESLEKRARSEDWTQPMREEAKAAAATFAEERQRIEQGIRLLAENERLLAAFKWMNAAMEVSARGRYDRWRPFQVGFLLANLASLTNPAKEAEVADIVWFATGGGKTETYLGIIVTAAFFDRLRGKASGVTAWSRFPLRMLSLQQTQRFADAMAAAEIVRRREKVPGDPFSVGFFVGGTSTPNSIKKEAKRGEADPDDEAMPERYRILLRCPFCRRERPEMKFNRRTWTLEHRCGASGCPWPEEGLPFYVVDDEVYRFLPTIVVGTLDKAATVSMQASMRGLVGSPWARCSAPGHGYTYAPRSTKKNGCLVPDCRAQVASIGDSRRFAPTLRLQDELHLLKDSLGAVDSHYESLLDHLQEELSGHRPKVLGSSATLTGYEKQVEILYRREARVFPAPGPTVTKGFWTSESKALARRFVALGPRGVTVEYAVDRSLTVLQEAVRELKAEPERVCKEIGIAPENAEKMVSLYGVDVVYGNTLRDLDAATRSFETQIKVAGPLNTATLTGRTPFEEVRSTLEKLDAPDPDFDKRIHVIAASSMMSHGVDVDRLNVMMILGLPLTTAEFIQTSARVGRKYPGLVLVFPKMARERDAGVFRSFEHFVRQGDRFVEPIPITRRSRRVLGRTFPGLFMARVLQLHEPASKDSLSTIDKLRKYLSSSGATSVTEFDALCGALGFDGTLDEGLRKDLRERLDHFFVRLGRPTGDVKFPSDLLHEKPMMSLRDVEETAPIFGLEKR